MAYATYTDLIDQMDEATLIQLADDNADGQADPGVVDAAIAQADAEINARVGGRYAVPLSPVPALAVRFSAMLAAANLYIHRGVDVPDSLAAAVADARSLMNRIGDGKASWGESVQPAADRTALDVRSGSQPRVFDRVKMKPTFITPRYCFQE